MDEFDEYEIEEFGFTTSECESMLAALNGLVPVAKAINQRELLVEELRECASGSQRDMRLVGVDLDFPIINNAETPHILLDCAERVEKLSDLHAIAVRYFIAGFWSGVEIAREQNKERDPRS